MSKSAEYRLTPEAARDMETIWLYTLKEWGLEQANRYTDELTEAFGQLLITTVYINIELASVRQHSPTIVIYVSLCY